MRELDAVLEKQLGEITQAEFIALAREHHETDDIGRILEARSLFSLARCFQRSEIPT
jgi:hypothetical protein